MTRYVGAVDKYGKSVEAPKLRVANTFMAMRYTHAPNEGIRLAMQLLTQTETGTNGRANLGLADWTDTKVPTVDGNGQPVLPVSV